MPAEDGRPRGGRKAILQALTEWERRSDEERFWERPWTSWWADQLQAVRTDWDEREIHDLVGTLRPLIEAGCDLGMMINCLLPLKYRRRTRRKIAWPPAIKKLPALSKAARIIQQVGAHPLTRSIRFAQSERDSSALPKALEDCRERVTKTIAQRERLIEGNRYYHERLLVKVSDHVFELTGQRHWEVLAAFLAFLDVPSDNLPVIYKRAKARQKSANR